MFNFPQNAKSTDIHVGPSQSSTMLAKKGEREREKGRDPLLAALSKRIITAAQCALILATDWNAIPRDTRGRLVDAD